MTREGTQSEVDGGSEPPVPLFAMGLDELLLVTVLLMILLAVHVHGVDQQRSRSSTGKIVLSPDGSRLACGGGVFDLGTGRSLCRLPGDVADLDFSPDSTTLATIDGDGVVTLREAATGKEIRTWQVAPREWEGVVRYHPDGDLVATVGDDASVSLWSCADGQLRKKIVSKLQDIDCIRFAPGQDLLLLAEWDGKRVQIWKARQAQLRSSFRVAKAYLSEVAVSPDGNTVAIPYGRVPPPYGTSVCLWDTVKNGETVVLEVPSIHCLEFSRGGQYLLVGHHDGATLLDVEKGEVRAHLPSGSNTHAARFVDGDTTLVTATLNGIVRFWGVESGRRVREVKVGLSPTPISWFPVAGFALWITLWDWAYRRRRRHPERVTGRKDSGVLLLGVVATVFVVEHALIGLAPGASHAEPAYIFLAALLAAAAVGISCVALMRGLTVRHRSRLIFTLPSVCISIWALLAVPPWW